MINKPLKAILLILSFLLYSCASTLVFPVSDVIPTANITAKKKKIKNGYQVDIEAEYLAKPSRIDPSKSVYVVWVDTKDGTKNIGSFTTENAESASLHTLTSYDFFAIFITAENQADRPYPIGPEISRIVLRD